MSRRVLRIQYKFLVVLLKSLVASRIDYYVGTLSLLILQASSLVFLFIAFSRRNELAGYTRDEALLFFAVAFTIQAIVQCTCEGLWLLGPKYVVQGDLDHVLTRPVPPLLLITMAHLHGSGLIHALFGAGLIAHTLNRVAPEASLASWGLIVYAVIAGSLIQFSLILAISSLSFLHGKVISLLAILQTLQQFLSYPLDIFPRLVVLVLTFVVPIAYTSYYPVLSLIRLSSDPSPVILAFIVELTGVTILCLAVSWSTWRWGLSHYQSASG